MVPKWPAGLAALCTAIAVAAPASAQVQVNSSALQQLAGPKATPAKPHHHHARHETARHVHNESRGHEARPHEEARHEAERHRAERRTVKHAAHHVAAAPLPLPPPVPARIREAAARLMLLPPPPPAPRPAAPKPPPPPPPHLSIDFLGRAATLGDVERGDIQRFLHKLATKKHRFLIRAAAPGRQGDPSVARRLSLQRGLAVQSVLVAAGIPPERIIVQSLGDPPGADTRRVVLSELP